MVLIINTSSAEAEIIIVENNFKTNKKWHIVDLSVELLANTSQLLEETNHNLKDIKRIIACHGPGSFTSTRIGIATANALAYTLRIPIFGFDAGLDVGLDVDQILLEASESGGKKLLTVKYSEDPKITINKKPSNAL